jgi:hypothetical protein
MKTHQAAPFNPAEAVSPIERRHIALDALVDERTLDRALRGATIRDLTRERIRCALAVRGLEHLLPGEAAR